MSFNIPDATLDKMLDSSFEDFATKLTVCEGQPSTYANATTAPGSGNMLSEVVIDDTDFTPADGDTSGRKTILGAQAGMAIAFTGGGNKLADHIALVNTAGTTLIGVWRNAEERSNTCQAGGSTTTAKLDASASAVDDAYNGLRIDIVSGTGSGQSQIITDYDGTTKIATITTTWTAPDATSDFVIYGKVVQDSDTVDVQAFDPMEILDAAAA